LRADVAPGEPARAQLEGLLAVKHFGGPTAVLALAPRFGLAGLRAFDDDGALEFGEQRKQLHHKLSHRVRMARFLEAVEPVTTRNRGNKNQNHG